MKACSEEPSGLRYTTTSGLFTRGFSHPQHVGRVSSQGVPDRAFFLPVSSTTVAYHRLPAIHSVTTDANFAGSSKNGWCPLRSKISIVAVGSLSTMPSHSAHGTV
jgi:hypothetical protein